MTHQEFTIMFAENYPEYTAAYAINGKFIFKKHIFNITHNCGFNFQKSFSNFQNSLGCAKCYGTFYKLTHELFVEYVDKNCPDYEIVGRYHGDGIKLEVRHKACQKTWMITPNNLKNGYGCSHCFGFIKWTQEKYEEWVNVNRPDYRVVGKYINTDTKVDMQHLICGLIWATPPRDFKYDHGCPNCNDTRITHKEFVSWAALNRPDYFVVGIYTNMATKISIKHECGYIWNVMPNLFKRGTGCPKCAKKISKPEQELFKTINDNFPDAKCNTRGLLQNKSFELDIYIPSLNKAIEFNGDYWHLRNEKAIDRDSRKKKQCEDASINLFTVWFSEWIDNKNAVITNCLKFLSGGV